MLIGNKNEFAIDIQKVSDENHTSKLKVYVNGKNICQWTDKETEKKETVWWNLDELISYLYSTIDFFEEDRPFPIAVEGECASELENNARDFESDNEEEVDDYYDKLNDWVYEHTWNHAHAGAVVPDVTFRNVDGKIEISWWNNGDEVDFINTYGYCLVDKEKYIDIITELFNAYNAMW